MRRMVVPLAILGMVLLVPTAEAAPTATLALDVGTRHEIEHNEWRAVPVTLTLRLSGFTCFDATSFPVTLNATSIGAADARLTQTVLQFEVPEGSYMAREYTATRMTNITLMARDPGAAEVRVAASFVHAGEPCIAPGGFPAARANATLQVNVKSPPESEPVRESEPGQAPREEFAAANPPAREWARDSEEPVTELTSVQAPQSMDSTLVPVTLGTIGTLAVAYALRARNRKE